MKKLNNQSFILLSIFLLSLTYAFVASYVVYKGGEVSEGTDLLWSFIFALVIALWTNNDAKAQGLYRPYEYSYFIFLFWPVVLPYHLVKTRKIEGLMVFLGVLLLFVLPFFTSLFVWAYFVPAS